MDKEQIANVFTDWDRRYRRDPTEFMTAVEYLLGNDPVSYGELAAAYFMWLTNELFPNAY